MRGHSPPSLFSLPSLCRHAPSRLHHSREAYLPLIILHASLSLQPRLFTSRLPAIEVCHAFQDRQRMPFSSAFSASLLLPHFRRLIE